MTDNNYHPVKYGRFIYKRLLCQTFRSDVIIVPHVQISAPNESCLYNRAISSGGGLLAGKVDKLIFASFIY